LVNEKIRLRGFQSHPLLTHWHYCFIALGLACWITLSGRAIATQPSVSAPETSPAIASIAQTDAATQSAPEPKGKPESQFGEDLKSTPISAKPIKVSIGLHVSNLADINQASETFDMAGYLLYSWHDPRLAYKPQPNGPSSKTSTLDQIWHPALEMVNFKDSGTSDTSVEILPDGTVLAQERFARTLSSGLALQNFPFDRQSLQAVLESLKYADRTVELIADPSKISIGTDNFVSLSEWQIGTLTGRNSKSFFPPEQQHYSRVTVEVHVKRNSGFYIFKVIMPLLLITIASWSVFWIDPQEFSTQIGIAFTNLLTVVALLLVINDALPRVGYLTLMDGFTMICFMAILIAILELVVTHRLEHESHRRAQKLHRMARWVVPTGFVLSNLILMSVMHFLR
jgi:Neurotransmitter-gated ion-channel ligand binding domain/Neurotransmitter-gated ion-channel transmembrane region